MHGNASSCLVFVRENNTGAAKAPGRRKGVHVSHQRSRDTPSITKIVVVVVVVVVVVWTCCCYSLFLLLGITLRLWKTKMLFQSLPFS